MNQNQTNIDQVRRFSCVVCGKKVISEERKTEQTQDGPYMDHCVVGGKLFSQRPHMSWLQNERIQVGFLEVQAEVKPETLPPGGICGDCLRDEVVVALKDYIRW